VRERRGKEKGGEEKRIESRDKENRNQRGQESREQRGEEKYVGIPEVDHPRLHQLSRSHFLRVQHQQPITLHPPNVEFKCHNFVTT
jgi:hypothetical protein